MAPIGQSQCGKTHLLLCQWERFPDTNMVVEDNSTAAREEADLVLWNINACMVSLKNRPALKLELPSGFQRLVHIRL